MENERFVPETDFVMARHSKKGKDSTEYEGLSNEGVELAKQEASKWLGLLDNAEEGTVMWLGGASEQIRTKSTIRALTEEINNILSQRENNNIELIANDSIDFEKGFNKAIEELSEKINSSPDKKFIISAPLFIKEFSGEKNRWIGKDNEPIAYYNELSKKCDGNEKEMLKEWLNNQGHLDGLEGPSPAQVAEEHLYGIKRLSDLAKEYIPNNPLIIGGVGQSVGLDALAIYLANDGKVNLEGYEKVNATGIQELEPIKIIDGKFSYGDRLEIDLNEHE
ncbi:MAG: hypothetical protein WC805_02025 [Patescibacteria group bacterium]|jgi:hypothetical protein